MTIVNYETWTNDKINWMKKHDHEYRILTSSLDENGTYSKNYVSLDGRGEFCEVSRPVYETVEVKGVKVRVKLLEVEYWTESEGSKYYYEAF